MALDMNGCRSIPMTSLMPGQRAVITRVDAGDQETERLMAMGVCGGRTVQLVQIGDPLIMKVYGTRVGVSARLADRILVCPCPDEVHTTKEFRLQELP